MRASPVRIALRPTLGALLACALACGRSDEPSRGTTPTADTLRVLAYNIHHGEGMDSVVDLERIAALIRDTDADVVTLQEVDSVTTRTGGLDQTAELARLTGLYGVFGRFMPYQGGAYGMALLARWPLEAVRNIRLPEGAEPRTALSATVTLPATGQTLRVVGIHLYRTDGERLAQATTLLEMLGEDRVPTVLAGDFNSTPDSEVMSFLAHSWEIVAKGDDRLTFPSYAPAREIDYVLFRPPDRIAVAGQRLMAEPVISDHRPVVVDLVIGEDAR